MSIIPFETIGTPGQVDVYRPSFLAPEMHGDPLAVDNLGVHIACGRLPGAKNGGIVDVGGGRLFGVDHVAGVFRSGENGPELIILGTETDDVHAPSPNHEVGIMKNEGLVALTDLERGILKIGAIVAKETGWTYEQLTARGFAAHRIGGLVIGIPSFELPSYRIHMQNGFEAIARPM